MTLVSIGDLARVFQSRRMTAGLKADLSRLSQELTTGVRADITTVGTADYGPIANIERLLTTLEARKTTTAEAAVVAETMQRALESIQEGGRKTGQALLSVQGAASSTSVDTVVTDAKTGFAQLVSTLNTNAAGRSLFAGAATDRVALASAEDMLAALSAAISGQTTAADVAQIVDDWFTAPGGGFEASAYLGSSSPMGAFQVSEGETIRLDVRADDPALREVMKAYALASLVGDGALAGNPAQQDALLTMAGEAMFAADHKLTALRADLGSVQEQVENAEISNRAMQTSMELSRNALIAVDPYETATKLEAVYSQLETYYSITARLSRLSFTDYLR